MLSYIFYIACVESTKGKGIGGREGGRVRERRKRETGEEGWERLQPKPAQGARKNGRRNALIGSCATCDARGTGARALEGWKI